jgi:hypothetical protein
MSLVAVFIMVPLSGGLGDLAPEIRFWEGKAHAIGKLAIFGLSISSYVACSTADA